MKIAYVYSSSHEILKDYFFLGTMCEQWELIEKKSDEHSTGDYLSSGWSKIVKEKIKTYIEVIKNNTDEIVVFSDVDITWFKPVQEIIKQCLTQKDIVFQKENLHNEEVNTGFIAIRCNKDVENFFQDVLDNIEDNDQTTVNLLLSNNKIKCNYGFLPVSFSNDNLSPCQDILLYHSICTKPKNGKTSLQIKYEKLLKMRSFVLNSQNILR
jgi:hypothetical protein